MRGHGRTAAFALLLALAGPASAQSVGAACEHTPAILAGAELLLREPVEKKPFWRDRHGAEAAYLTIRYGGLGFGIDSLLLERLESRAKPPERMAELRMSHASTKDRLALIALLDPALSRGSPLPVLGGSALRALVVEDGGAWLIAEMKRWLQADPAARGLAQSIATAISRSIADTDDATKASLASAAVAADLWQLAFAVQSVRNDLVHLVALVDRAPPGTFSEAGPLTAEQRQGLLRQALNVAEQRIGFDVDAQPEEIRAMDAKRSGAMHFRNLYRLASRFPDAAILGTMLNQTGEVRIASELVPELLAGIVAGRFDPQRAPDPLFVDMVEGLDRILGREVREKQLAGFSMIDPRGVQRMVARDHADRIVARVALAAIVTGSAGSVGRPGLLSKAFDWDRAEKTARRIANGQPTAEADRELAADLLAAAGKHQSAVAMLATMSNEDEAQQAAHLLVAALDRACANVLAPALPFGSSLFRFAPRS